MIHCINLNATWDTVQIVPKFKSAGVNRATRVFSYPGGKGNNAARAVARLGGQAMLHAFCGQEHAAKAKVFYIQAKVKAKLTIVPGQNRPCWILLDEASNTETVVNSPSQIQITRSHLEKLKTALLASVKSGDMVAFSGSLPEGTARDSYRRLIEAVRAKGAVAMLDAYGPALSEGVKAQPFLVKPNAEEITQSFGWPAQTRPQMLKAGFRLLKMGIRVVILTLGSKGALAFMRLQGRPLVYWVKPLKAPGGLLSPVGCGDSFFGAMAQGLEQGLSLGECLKHSTAAAWANLGQPGAVFFDASQVRRQAKRVQIGRIAL